MRTAVRSRAAAKALETVANMARNVAACAHSARRRSHSAGTFAVPVALMQHTRLYVAKAAAASPASWDSIPQKHVCVSMLY